MDLDETFHVGLRPEKTKPCTFPAKSCYEFRREREKWVAEALLFVTCTTHHGTTSVFLSLSLDRFPPKFPRTCTCPGGGSRHMVSYSRKVSIKGSNLPKKTFFLGYSIYDQPTGHGKRSATPTLFPSPSGYPIDVPFLGDFC